MSDIQHDLARLAALHREQAEVFERVTTNLAELFAAPREPRLMEPMVTERPELLTAAEVASLLRVDACTLRQMRRMGETPPSLQVGRRPRWRRADVDAWLAERGAP
ncbi:MAG: helix-turn-helix domain-containing protein [Planctomycetes bacterium]|nr:helix-turn-helix domain-containing protein [Planctomycetota bacterium]